MTHVASHLRRVAPAAVLAAALAWSGVCAAAPASWAGLRDLPLQGLDGQPVRPGGLDGRAVVVDLWATWCAPCLEALPRLEALARDLGPRGLRVVAISQDSDVGKARAFVQRLGLRHLTVLLDPERRAAPPIRPEMLPTTVLFDGEGAERHRLSGYDAGGERALRRAAEAVLPQDPVARWFDVVREVMGTRFAIRALVTGAPGERAVDRALDRVAELDARWSPWIEGSDVHRVNTNAGGVAVAVDPSTSAVLRRSLDLCAATGRAFDVTFFPLGLLYDFRTRPFVPPAPARIAEVLPLVDCRGVELDDATHMVRLKRPGMALHMGGNAKGSALDEAAAVLRAAGLRQFFVDGGGDVVTAGDGPKGPWRVGVQHPRGPRGQVIGVVHSVGGGVATSGDYERFAVVDGRRYHHIVDTRTGEPAAGCASATVVAPDGPRAGETADAWATVLCVLGPAEGLPLAARHVPGLEAAVYTTDGELHTTRSFPAELPSRLAMPGAETQ